MCHTITTKPRLTFNVKALVLVLIVAAALAGPGYGLPTTKDVERTLSQVALPKGYFEWAHETRVSQFSLSDSVWKAVGHNGPQKGDYVIARVFFASEPKPKSPSGTKNSPGRINFQIQFHTSAASAANQAWLFWSGYRKQSSQPDPEGTITGRKIHAKAWHFWSQNGPPGTIVIQEGAVMVRATYQPPASWHGKGIRFEPMTGAAAKKVEDMAISLFEAARNLSESNRD